MSACVYLCTLPRMEVAIVAPHPRQFLADFVGVSGATKACQGCQAVPYCKGTMIFPAPVLGEGYWQSHAALGRNPAAHRSHHQRYKGFPLHIWAFPGHGDIYTVPICNVREP